MTVMDGATQTKVRAVIAEELREAVSRAWENEDDGRQA